MLFLAVMGLSGMAISSRIANMINHTPEFYTLYGMDGLQIVTFIAAVCVLLPVVMGAICWLLNRYRLTSSFALGIVVLLLFVVILGFLRDMNDPTGGALTFAAAGLLAVGAFLLFLRVDIARVFVAATAIGLPLTLYNSLQATSLFDREDDVADQEETPVNPTDKLPNVAFVIFDELPLTTLLKADGTIDSNRFPNFAALAGEAHWYREASSVSCNTTTAVPAILSGNLFGEDTPESVIPNAQNYPRNLFTLLADTHDVEAWESLTRLCPGDVCSDSGEDGFITTSFAEHVAVAWLHASLPEFFDARLPDLDKYWMEAAAIRDVDGQRDHRAYYAVRVRQYDQFLRSIESSGDKPWLRFGHFLLPHSPFELLPDGSSYFRGSTTYGIEGKTWGHQDEHVHQSYFRHMLQAMYADRLVGRLVDRLKSVGEYDDTAIVIVADHGVSFVPGDDRRRTNEANYADLIGVPFFLKRAGQGAGDISDSPAQTIDMLPTLLSSMGLDERHDADGRNLLAPEVKPISDRLHFCSGTTYMRFPRVMLPAMLESVKRKDELFGDQADGTLEMNFASHPEWIGRGPDEIGDVRSSEGVVRLQGLVSSDRGEAQKDYITMNLNGGIVDDGSMDVGDLLFVATLNGKIASTMPPVRHKDADRVVSMMLQPSLLRTGENTVRLYAITQTAKERPELLHLKLQDAVSRDIRDELTFEKD